MNNTFLKLKIIFLLFSLIIIQGCKKQPYNFAEAEKVVEKMVEENEIPGLAVTVSKGGEIVWSEGFGWAEIEQGIPANPSKTKFRIGSISKPLATAALGILMDVGKIGLDIPVQEYVPTFPEKRWAITTRQVAGHTAGIRHYKNQEWLSAKRYLTVLEGLQIFQDDSLLFEPGTDYNYSSYGFNLLSAIIEGAASKEFLAYMQNNVFDPIGMENTIADYTDSLIVNRAGCYSMSGGKIINAAYVDNSYKWAGGGFLSTSEDLVKFGNAMLYNTIISEETTTIMTTSQKLANGKETGYGIGWFVDKNDFERPYFGHAGGSVGGRCELVIFPKEELVVAITTNDSRANLSAVHELAEVFLGEEE